MLSTRKLKDSRSASAHKFYTDVDTIFLSFSLPLVPSSTHTPILSHINDQLKPNRPFSLSTRVERESLKCRDSLRLRMYHDISTFFLAILAIKRLVELTQWRSGEFYHVSVAIWGEEGCYCMFVSVLY